MTSIKTCTNLAKTYIRGIQVTYGKFDEKGEIVDAVSLNSYGDLAQASSLCTNMYIPVNDHISFIGYAYNPLGVSYIEFRTASGLI